MAAATALSPLQTLRNLFGSQTPSKPSVPIHCPTYHSRPLPLPNPATKLTDPASSTSAATTLSDDKHRIIVGARMTNAELLSDDSTATTSNPKRIIINASGKLVEYQFPAGRLTIKVEPPDVLLVRPDVDPQEMRVRLKSLCGGFRPGKLTALTGVSGAGKTTLMDVLAGRKTEGYIDGDISISGYPKKQETFVRISGYCEQNDIHSPHVTDYESLVYAERLWLSSEMYRISRYCEQNDIHSPHVTDYESLVYAERLWLSSEMYRKTLKILPYAGLGNMNPRFGVGHEKLQWFLDAAQTHPNELYTVGDYGYLGTTVTTVDNFGDAGSPPLNYIDGIQARSSYLTVGGGLGINHYNGGIIPPTLINLNNTACDFVPSQGGPLIIEHTNRIFRRISSHQILWISLLMAGSLFFFNPSIRSIIKIIISFIHSSDGNYINLDALMSLMQFFGLRRQSSAALFCSVGITSETRKSPFKLMSMMMGVAWFLLGSFKGSKHDLVNSALDQVKEKFAAQQIPPPNTLLQLKFFLDFVTSGGGCTQISLFMVAIFHGKLFTVLAELFTVLAESSFLKKNLDQHLKLRAEIPKHSKLRDIVFVAKTIADIQNHGEGKYNDQLHVQFDPVISSRESALLMVTCKVRAKDVDEYKERMSYLRLIVEGVIKDEQLYHGETWPVQRFF